MPSSTFELFGTRVGEIGSWEPVFSAKTNNTNATGVGPNNTKESLGDSKN